jgi:type IV fimbrial biogenesis protein FimT
MKRKTTQSGVTLVELVIVVLLSAITAAFAAPAFDSLIKNSRMSVGAVGIVTALLATRSEAVARKRQVTVCTTGDPTASTPACDATKSWKDGWILFVDADKDNEFDAGETLLATHEGFKGAMPGRHCSRPMKDSRASS